MVAKRKPAVHRFEVRSSHAMRDLAWTLLSFEGDTTFASLWRRLVVHRAQTLINEKREGWAKVQRALTRATGES